MQRRDLGGRDEGLQPSNLSAALEQAGGRANPQVA